MRFFGLKMQKIKTSNGKVNGINGYALPGYARPFDFAQGRL
jgi:hypothetical protein